MVNKKNFITAASFSILLAACGGGDGDSRSSSEAATTPGASNSGTGSGTPPADSGTTDPGTGNPPDTGGESSSGADGTEWTITDLSALLGGNARPEDINNAGEIVGEIVVRASSTGAEPDEDAFVFRQGQLTSLGTLGGIFTQALGMNDKGDIVGVSTLPGKVHTVVHGFIYRDGTMQDPKLAEGNFSFRDINDKGDIIGSFDGEKAFLLRDGKIEIIPNIPGTSLSKAEKINASGKVLGTSHNFGDLNSVRSFLYANGSTQDLSSGAGCRSSAYQALNDTDQLAGLCDGRLVIRSGTSVKALGAIEGAEKSDVIDMNNSGQVVGNFYVAGSNLSQVFFYDGSRLMKLGEASSIAASGWTLFQAKEMNESGQIFATAFRNSLSDLRYVLLTPAKK